jgi:hypothetical protein
MTFIGAVCVDQRQSHHIMRIVVGITEGGVAQVAEETVPGLLSLAKQGLRQEKMVTPVETLLCQSDRRLELTSLGRTLLKEMAEAS